jgi:hypothetical protein
LQFIDEQLANRAAISIAISNLESAIVHDESEFAHGPRASSIVRKVAAEEVHWEDIEVPTRETAELLP